MVTDQFSESGGHDLSRGEMGHSRSQRQAPRRFGIYVGELCTEGLICEWSHQWSTLRDELRSKPGAAESIAAAQERALEELRLYELRHAEAVSQAELAGRLEVTQGAISKFEHADDVRISTLRQYLEALGARLALVAVFDDEDRRVPIELGKQPAA